jgi:uncharacterized protein (TIGR01244 family)
MNAVKLTQTIAVAGQIGPEQVPGIAAAGYKVLVNNRPDGEDPGQPASLQVEAAALAAGLEYHHIPVTAMDFPGADAPRMAKLFDDETRPVFAFCRSGTRCANLWVATRSEEARQRAADRGRELGYDLAMADRAWSSRRGVPDR